MSDEKTITGFKGFDKNLMCRDKQYKINTTFEENVDPKKCEKGMHYCEHPLDVFSYYSPSNSRYCKVEGGGKLDIGSDKISCSKLKISTEIGLGGLIGAGVKFILNRVKWTKEKSATGDCSGASTTGDYSGASATGDYSGASATGYKSGASATGDYSGASATGYKSGASATGDYSGASTTGDCSGASTTGDYSGASTTGDCSGASTTGYKSGASATGYKSGASATGYKSGASATGDCSGASATGDYSGASATGYKSGASATGYKSGASATGDCSGALVVGDKSHASVGGDAIAIAIGKNTKVRGKKGAYLVLTECIFKYSKTKIKDVKLVKVDGVGIKEDTFYSLIDGKIKEVN